MELLLGLILAAKSLVLMGGIVTPGNTVARLTGMEVVVSGKSIMVDCGVKNAYPMDLRQFALSGTPI